MNGLVFETAGAPRAADPNRADIACFVGFVARRAAPLPASVRDALGVAGWLAGPWQRAPADVDALLQLPVTVDSWAAFDALFAWDARPLGAGTRRCASYLGAAVRSFFAHGGRRAVVVRCGDPWPYREADAARSTARAARLDALLASAPGRAATPHDPPSWRGLGHLFGLPEVALVCVPDLADLCAGEPTPLPVTLAAPSAPEVFVECSDAELAPPAEDVALRALAPPRCDAASHARWRRALDAALALLADTAAARQLRETMLVAALPLPALDASAEGVFARVDLPAYLERTGVLAPRARGDGARGRPADALVQLVWPWLRTPRAADLPGLVEPPDGVLAGLIAANALARGTFRSVAGTPLPDVLGAEPPPARCAAPGTADARLARRVCVIAPGPDGWALRSDVTRSADPDWRAGAVSRLVGAVLRAARRSGEAALFEPSGPALWAQLRHGLEQMLTAFWREGGLGGASPDQAFGVRCDASTMSRHDLDHGRLRAELSLLPVAAVERITVVLELGAGHPDGVTRIATETSA